MDENGSISIGNVFLSKDDITINNVSVATKSYVNTNFATFSYVEDNYALKSHNHMTYALLNHDMATHTYIWNNNANLETGSNFNLASVHYCNESFTKNSSDERVKKNFSQLPSNIDAIFDSISIIQYEFKELIPHKDGIYFGTTSQQIESILQKYGLNPDRYALTGKRQVDEETGEHHYIHVKDSFHYINQDCLTALCIDQIQKLKRHVKQQQQEIQWLQSQLATRNCKINL